MAGLQSIAVLEIDPSLYEIKPVNDMGRWHPLMEDFLPCMARLMAKPPLRVSDSRNALLK